MTDMTSNNFNYSARDMRQIRRNLKKMDISVTIQVVEPPERPTKQKKQVDDDLSYYDEEYSTKENTRRIKRSHEKKVKRNLQAEFAAADEKEEVEMEFPDPKRNTRRLRKQTVEKELLHTNDKHVSFYEEPQPKGFRLPSGRNIKRTTEEPTYRRTSKRLRPTKDYYESDFEYDDTDEDYVLEEDVASFLFHTFINK